MLGALFLAFGMGGYILLHAPSRVWVESLPGGASLYLDGVYSGKTPIVLEGVRSGPHVLTLDRPGYSAHRSVLDTEQISGGRFRGLLDKALGRAAVREVRLKPLPEGGLVVTSLPRGADVLVNGFLKGLTPLRLDRVTPGRHEVRLVKKGYYSVQATVDVRSDRSASLHRKLTSRIVEVLKTRLAKDPDSLQDHIDLAHQYLMMGEHAKGSAALRDAYKVIKEGRVRIYPDQDEKPESRFYSECWKTFTYVHRYPEKGSNVIRKTCIELMRKAYDNDPSMRGLKKLLDRMEDYAVDHPVK